MTDWEFLASQTEVVERNTFGSDGALKAPSTEQSWAWHEAARTGVASAEVFELNTFGGDDTAFNARRHAGRQRGPLGSRRWQRFREGEERRTRTLVALHAQPGLASSQAGRAVPPGVRGAGTARAAPLAPATARVSRCRVKDASGRSPPGPQK